MRPDTLIDRILGPKTLFALLLLLAAIGFTRMPHRVSAADLSFAGITDGQEVHDTIAIQAIPSNTSQVDRIEFILVGRSPQPVHIERASPYYYKGDFQGTPFGWNTHNVKDGSYTLIAIVYEKDRSSYADWIFFTVANGTPTIDTPTPTQRIQATNEPTRRPTGLPTSVGTPVPTTVAGVGICGESMNEWHPPVVNGCNTGHEHGDAPPSWISQAGYQLRYQGGFSTSPKENTLKHAVMKGFSTKLNGVDIYFRIHAGSNPMDRSSRYHSYEAWARDPSGNVSHWQLWYNTGDPRPWNQGGSRVPRRNPPLPEDSQRPIVAVVDQESLNEGIGCEQWYAAPGQPEWGWDFGWTICGATTLYNPNENATAEDKSTWTPTGNLGGLRRLEAAWYTFRQHPTGKFYSTQFGEIVSGPTDARCGAKVTKFGTEYTNVCLEQYIAPTMIQVSFPGNAEQKTFNTSGVQLPN